MTKRLGFSKLQFMKRKVISEKTISDFYNYIVDVWNDKNEDKNCDIFPLNRGDLLRACKLLSYEKCMSMSNVLTNELRDGHIPLHEGNKKSFEDIIKEKIGD